MRKSNYVAVIVAIAALGLSTAGCASSESYSSNDSNQTGPVSTVAADPMGAAIFGTSPQPTGNPDVANVDPR